MEKELIKQDEVKEIVTQEQEGLSINTKNAELVRDNLEKLNLLAETIKAALIEGLDYGVIPGVQKPSLFKPGAEKIALMYGLTQEYQILENIRDKEEGIILYKFKAMLFNGAGKQITEGYGLCSSQEKKYSKQNPFDIENTILKMAKKRALVDAAISIGVLSQVFTQDVEDLKLTSANAQMGRFEKLKIYTLIYNVFSEYLEYFKDKDDYKNFMKSFIPGLLKRANISTMDIMEFTAKDKQQLLDYLNDPNYFTKEQAILKDKKGIKE